MDTTVNGEPRVTATDAALNLIAEIKHDYPEILFHQSGGCCDGSSPMCYPTDDFIVGDHDVKLGEIGGVPVYISGSQFEVWKHTQLIIDVVPGRGGRPMAPHLNLWIVARGINIGLSTRMYFADEAEANGKDPVLNLIEQVDRRATLLAARETRDGRAVYRFDIRLQGEGETVFLDV